MKPLLFPALAVSAIATTLALTGCTVHNHYYGNTNPAAPGAIAAAAESPGHTVLADQLDGVHTAMDVAAINLANTYTMGYKARRVTFVEGQAQPNITLDWTAGSPQITNRPLDLYIEGDGFFQVDVLEEFGGGVAYTRVGNFFVNRDGDILLGNSDGPRLSDGINLPSDIMGITFSADGEVDVIYADNSISAVGSIMLHTFYAPDGLEPIGNGLFTETERSGPATQTHPGQGSTGMLTQGMLENSNVDLIEAIANHRHLADRYNVIAEELGLPAYRGMLPLPTGPHTSLNDEFGILLGNDH